jgi:hypothetical protein
MAGRNALRGLTIAGLVTGAAGIGVLWASGVEFPIYPPPGILILLSGALFTVFAPWRWAPIVGTLLGLFIIVGFLVSPTGIGNLTGDAGVSVALGTIVQLGGVLVAAAAGLIATTRAKVVNAGL